MNKEKHKKKPNLVIKPSLINALVPMFLKSFFAYFFIFLGLYFLIDLISIFFNSLVYNISFVNLLILVLIFSLISISVKLIILKFTTYYFYDISGVKEFNLIIIRRRSVVYSRITNVSLKMSVWDRITRAGKIILHTGDDEVPDLILNYVKKPRQVEDLIYSLIHKKNKEATQRVVY